MFPPIKESYRVFCLFIIVAVLSTFLNIGDVLTQFFKQKTGIHMFLVNLFMLLYAGVGLVILILTVFKDIQIEVIFKTVRKVLLASFIFVFFYAVIQFLILRLGFEELRAVYYSLDVLPFVRGTLFYSQGRLNSVSYEVPALGTYLVFISGWMFSYTLTHKSTWRFVPFTMVLLLVYFSGARSAILSVIPQVIVILLFLSPIRNFINKYKKVCISIIVLGGIFILSLAGWAIKNQLNKEGVESIIGTSISNKSRIGMQVASIKVFMDSPVYGVGLGQETYYKRGYYPEWAVKDNYEFTNIYLNENERMYPPAFNLYTKLLAELGIVGFTVFIIFLVVVVKESIYEIKRGLSINQLFAKVLLISFVGLIINWGQNDDYILYGFWISYGFLLLLKKDSLENV